MRDPFPIAPIPALSKAVQPWADRLGLPTLPLHIHEVLFAAGLYTFTQVVVSPWLSTRLFPAYYPPKTARARRVNWDTHVVSLVQSVLVLILAVWVMFADNERWNMDWEQRIWGYTGGCGMVQAFAAGYFVWDLAVTVLHYDIFGFGVLVHAVCALTVYVVGFRPFLNFYASTSMMYELSTPFLNIHWFFDKLHMTGSRAQLYNGIALLFVFFAARLIYGTIMSVIVYRDIYRAVFEGPTMAPLALSTPKDAGAHSVQYGNESIMVFAQNAGPIPVWLAGMLLVSNLSLNTLNWWWYQKMIRAVRKRFEPSAADEKTTAPKGGVIESTGTQAVSDGVQQGLRKRRTSIIEEIIIEDDFTEVA